MLLNKDLVTLHVFCMVALCVYSNYESKLCRKQWLSLNMCTHLFFFFHIFPLNNMVWCSS